MRSVFHLALDWLVVVLALAEAAAAHNWAIYLVSIVLVGTHLHRIALLGHEGAHGTLAPRSRAINDFLSNFLVFYPLGVTLNGYKSWHLKHHATAGLPQDTERQLKHGFRWTAPVSPVKLAAISIGDLFGAGSNELLRLMWILRPVDLRDAVGLVIFDAVVATLVVTFHAYTVLSLYFASLFTIFWMVFRIRGLTEHLAANNSFRTHRFTVNWLLAYFVFPYRTFMHWEHHKWPHRSWHQLGMTREVEKLEPILSLAQVLRALDNDHLKRPAIVPASGIGGDAD